MATNEKAWKALMALANARTVAKQRESELIGTRKDLENQLDTLGAGNTADHLRVSRDYVVTLRSIEFERDRLKTLADQMERTITEAQQGKFEFAEEIADDERALLKRPKETDLFHKPDPKPESKPEDKRPVGRPKPEAPEPAIADGENQHLTASVNDLDLAERAKGKLIAAGLTTIGRLFEVIEQEGGEVKLEEAANVTTAVAGAIVKAARSWQKAHRKAARAVEKEAVLSGGATL